MASPEPEYPSLLDEDSWTKNLLEAGDLVREYRMMSGDYELEDE